MTVPIKIINKEKYDKENGKPDQEEIWDSIAKPWKKYVVKKLSIVESFLEGKKGKIVDLGCGTGRNMISDQKEKVKYYGIDFSSGQIVHAKRYAKNNKLNAELFCGKIDCLDKSVFKNNMFDYGLYIATLHCLETRKERLNSLKEFYRILKKGGEGLISVWDSSDPRFKEIRKEKCKDIYMSWREEGKCFMRYYYLYDKEELIGQLKRIGFKILEIYKPTLHDRFSKKNLVVRVGK